MKAAKTQEIEPTCGSCGHCRGEAEELLCMALPPMLLVVDDQPECIRGRPVDASDVACIYFKAKR